MIEIKGAYMTITINGNTIKWWPALIPAFLAAYHSLSPVLSNYVTAHPGVAIWVSAATIFLATLLKSPIASSPQAAGDTLAAAIAKARKG